MIITYTARRSPRVGHVIGTNYSLTIGTSQKSRSRAVEKTTQRSLSGKSETLYGYADETWNVTFVPINGALLPSLKEFLDSTEGGEQFGMTLNGDVADMVSVKRTDSGYSWASFLEVGDDGLDWVQASIVVLKQ